MQLDVTGSPFIGSINPSRLALVGFPFDAMDTNVIGCRTVDS